jgi:hypothetical protein
LIESICNFVKRSVMKDDLIPDYPYLGLVAKKMGDTRKRLLG